MITIHYTKKDEPKKDMINLPELLQRLRFRWLERVVYTRIAKPFSLSVEEIPPLIPSVLSGDVIFDTEAEKKSVYLESGSKPSGDQAMLHKMIVDGSIDIKNLQELQYDDVVKACSSCNIATSGKSKQFLCGMLQGLYASILIGNCTCHSFGKLPGHTGGFYHLVCRHGSTVASKFLSLTESVRDAADLYLSLKHPPVVFINDTPCGFVRHMECRDPAIAQELWGSTAGCFQTPTLHQDPEGNQNFPCIVPLEYSDGSNIRKQSSVVARSHPLIDTTKHFVPGDWFHASANPHQSHLCKFHDLDLCLQANTIKASIQESQNNRKNQRRLRSSTVQNFETHVTFNYLMDFYQNEEVVDRQQKILKQRLSEGQHLTRDNCLRFKIVSK